MDQAKHSVFIIILHYKDISLLSDCLASLKSLATHTLKPQILIVDNGSHLQVQTLSIKPWFPISIRIITSKDNKGYAKGSNIGIKEALSLGADYILLLNNDTVVSPSFLDILIETAEKTSNAGILGPKIHFYSEPGKIWFAGARFDSETCMLITPKSGQIDEGMDTKPLESDYITGCALLVKRAVIEKIGLLDGDIVKCCG